MSGDTPPAEIHGRALANLSEHLRGLLGDIARIERAIARLQARAHLPASQELVDLQRIDLVQQTLEDLAILTSLMSRGAASPDALDRSLKLAATRALVAEADPRDNAAPGDLDLF